MPGKSCSDIFGLSLMRKSGETKAFFYDVLFRGPLFISVLFLSTAFLKFANKEAGCTEKGHDIVGDQTEDEADEAEIDCSGKVAFGIRPSSVLTTLNAVAGLLLAVLLPIFGAIIDHTSYRKQCVLYFGALFWLCNVLQIFTTSATWALMVLIQGVFSSSAYTIHQTALFAYAPEILDDLDKELGPMNAAVRVWELVTMLSFMIGVTIFSAVLGLGDDVVGKSAVSQTVASLVSVYPFVVVARNLGDRPRLKEIETSENVLTAGFRKPFKTIQSLRGSHSEVLKFLRALLFFESANGSIIFASTTLITQQLQIADPSPILIAILVVTVLGAALVPFVHRRFGVKTGMCIAVGMNVLGSLVVILFVNSPETKGRVWIVGLLYGLGLGATYPMQRTLYMLIIPAGQETEMMGLLQFASIVFAWAPGLVFTTLNEHMNDLRLAMFAVLGFHSVGLLLLLLVDVEKAREAARATEHLRHRGGGRPGGGWRSGTEWSSRV